MIRILFLLLLTSSTLTAQTAIEYHEQGLNALKQNKTYDAIRLFEKAIELKNDFEFAHFDKGIAYGNLGDFKKALLCFEKLIEFSKDEDLLKNSYLNLAWIHRNITKNLPAALQNAKQVILLDSTDCVPHDMIGVILVETNQLEEAIKSFDTAIRLCPSNPEYYYNRGVTKEDLNLLEEAIKDLSIAIKLDSTYVDAYFARGIIKGNLNLINEEIDDYSKALKIDPNYLKAYINRGLAKDLLGDFEGAIKDHNRAIEGNDKYAFAYNNRGFTKYKLGDFESAKADCEKSIELNSDNSYAYHYLGLIEYELGNTEKACHLFQKAVSMGKEDAKKDILEKCSKQ